MEVQCTLGLVVLLLSFGKQGETKLQFSRQKPIVPVTREVFALGAADTKLVEIQRLGALTKWVQIYKGVQVYGSAITTHNNKAGLIDRVEGFKADAISAVSTKPTIPGSLATDVVKIRWGHVALKNVSWRIDEPELFVLVETETTSKLVWLTSYYVEQADGVHQNQLLPAYIIGLVNAHSGVIEETWSNLQHAAIVAITGNDKIGSSIEVMDVVRVEETCWHVDNGRRVQVYDMLNKRYISEDASDSFICDRASSEDFDLHEFTGGYSPRNEAFLYTTKFVDMWENLIGVHEIQPYRTDSSYLEVYTHYGYQVENAFFNGFSFVIGDGQTVFYPLTSSDIICHELGHAITQWKGGKMEYRNEPGAVNEAYSNIVGETCDMVFKNKTNYLIGDDIMRPGQKKAMTDMCNPSSLGGLEHYKEYNDSVSTHMAAGIYDKAWCILTKQWDHLKTFQVFTRANLMYWSTQTTMHCGACGVASAAADQSLKTDDVTAAFKLVGVDCSLCGQ